MNCNTRRAASISEKNTLRACKVLCKKSGDIGNYGEAKRLVKIGIYIKMHRIIERKKADALRK